jgi:hypothetical protein
MRAPEPETEDIVLDDVGKPSAQSEDQPAEQPGGRPENQSENRAADPLEKLLDYWG